MGLFWPVNTVHKLCRHKIAEVFHSVRCGVNVVVATFSVVTEAVGVLYTQIQTLESQQRNDYKHTSGINNALEVFKLTSFVRGEDASHSFRGLSPPSHNEKFVLHAFCVALMFVLCTLWHMRHTACETTSLLKHPSLVFHNHCWYFSELRSLVQFNRQCPLLESN